MSTAIIEPSVDVSWFLPAPEPGLYPETPYETYDRWAAARSSLLKDFRQSPLHARYAMLHPGEDATKAKTFGQALHVAVLEPERFAATFLVMPDFGDRRSSKVRLEEIAFRANRPEITFLSQKDYDQAIAMRDAAWAHPTARAILAAPGKNELSAVWKDPVTGVPCKGRQDKFCAWAGYPTLADVKSTVDASRQAFSKAVQNYGYADQAAFYLDGFNALSPFDGDRRYVLIALEKDPPFAVAVYDLDTAAIEVGRRRYRHHIDQYARCLESGVWPGYGDGCEIVSLPAWAMKEEEHY